MAEPGAQGDDQLQGAGDAEDDADPAPVIIPFRPVAGILEGLAGSDQAEELRGVDRLQDVGGDVEFHRVERNGRKKAAAPAVGHVGGLRVPVEVIGNPPMGRRECR